MKLSYIIRAYNAEATIRRAVTSARAQEFPKEDYEILVIDDGSTDTTAQVAEGVGAPNLRVVRQENKGIVEAANVGLREAKGDIVILLDADDEALPGSLSLAVSAMSEGAAYAYGDYLEEYQGERTIVRATDPFKAPAGAFAWRRKLLLAERGFPKGTVFPEYDILLKTWGRWHGARIAGPIFIYHRSKKSITGDTARIEQSLAALRAEYPERSAEVGQIRSYMLS